MTPEEVRGMQQFVMKFGLPCVIFNSCLTADIGTESLTSMVLVIPSVLIGTLWAFRARKKRFPYHNLPQLFTAQETGMLGIPLFLILFGADQAYRMGVLDVAQAAVAFPVIAILSADAGENPSPVEILKKVFSSPLLIMAALGKRFSLRGRVLLRRTNPRLQCRKRPRRRPLISAGDFRLSGARCGQTVFPNCITPEMVFFQSIAQSAGFFQRGRIVHNSGAQTNTKSGN